MQRLDAFHENVDTRRPSERALEKAPDAHSVWPQGPAAPLSGGRLLDSRAGIGVGVRRAESFLISSDPFGGHGAVDRSAQLTAQLTAPQLTAGLPAAMRARSRRRRPRSASTSVATSA